MNGAAKAPTDGGTNVGGTSAGAQRPAVEFALQAEGLVKTFPGVRALDRVNLQLRPGEVHALLGENGAGKSTLIKILTGVHQADEGILRIGGVRHDIDSPQQAMDAGIGVVHQERNVIRGFTVGENIAMGRMPRRGMLVDWPAVHRGARRALDLLDLSIDTETPMRSLSAAQTQLVEIARALYTETTVLLLDEPTASISPAESDRLFTVVHRLKEQGTAILFVSHKLEEVFAHCDTVSVLRDGQSVLESAPLSQHSKEDVVNLMVGRTLAALTVPDRSVDLALQPALELRDVDTAAGHRDVSLRVRPGEILGLYGLVGAGRTELARAILGLDRIVGGTVLVRGEAVKIQSVGQALKRHSIGYVTENRKEEGVFLEQSIARNIAVTVWGRLQGVLGQVSRKSEAALADTYIENLGIKVSSREQLAGQLSGGNQQKVSLAKWLAAETTILIIDEPTVGIDVRTKGSFYELIWSLADKGLAILLISSDLTEMVTLADRIAVMDDFAIAGTVANSHNYDSMSQAIIRLIHADPAAPLIEPAC